MVAPIKHVFVLMLENRAFDHLLGLSGLPGIPVPAPTWGLAPGAPDRAPLDPPHEFEDVQAQLSGGPANAGFHQLPYASVSLQGFAASTLPVLSTLARAYLLFDNWYASVPGPTWPNRFFVHAGSSGGLDNSPSAPECIECETIDSLGFTFQNGTLFQRLDAVGGTWRVYHGDAFPQVLASAGLAGAGTGDLALDRRGSIGFATLPGTLFRSHRHHRHRAPPVRCGHCAAGLDRT